MGSGDSLTFGYLVRVGVEIMDDKRNYDEL